jgi:hypothetical protein
MRADGVPVVHLTLPAQPGLPPNRRGGQADYHQGNTAGGLLQPGIFIEDLPEMFQFSSTGKRLVVPEPVPSLSSSATLGLIALMALTGAAGTARSRRRIQLLPHERRGVPALVTSAAPPPGSASRRQSPLTTSERFETDLGAVPAGDEPEQHGRGLPFDFR